MTTTYVQNFPDRPGEWFQVNPPDAKEGDEIFVADKWRDWKTFCREPQCTAHAARQRRRLLSPGEGFRICFPTETMPEQFAATFDGIKWASGSGFGDVTVKEWCEHNNSIAIRIPISPKSVDEWPKYWLHGVGKVLYRSENLHDVGAFWHHGQWNKSNGMSMLDWVEVADVKPISPAEAEKIMKGVAQEPDPQGDKLATGLGPRCSFCNWTNVNLLNIGNYGSPKWICHGCMKREIDKQPPLPTPVSEGLPNANRAFWSWDNQHKQWTFIVEVVRPEIFFEVQNYYTHWLYAEPPYGIPPAPVKDDGFDEYITEYNHNNERDGRPRLSEHHISCMKEAWHAAKSKGREK